MIESEIATEKQIAEYEKLTGEKIKK